MMKSNYSILIMLCLILMGCYGDGDNSPTCTNQNSTDDHLVIYWGNKDEFIGAVAQVGGAVERIHGNIGVAKVSGLTDTSILNLKKRIKIIAIGRDVEVDWLRQRVDEPLQVDAMSSTRVLNHNEPTDAAFYNILQWNMRTIEAGTAWSIEQGEESVRVAIVDTGINANHIDLTGKCDASASINLTSDNPIDLDDDNGHGTQIAGIISTNNIFIAGLAPHTTLINIKVLKQDGSGTFSDLIAGIMYAVDNAEADIINISFGSHFSSNYYECSNLFTSITALKKAIRYANCKGAFIAAAAGDGDETYLGINLDETTENIHMPSQIKGVLSVGATAPINQMGFDSLASYSNYGFSAVDVVAPGGNDLRLNGGFPDGLITSVVVIGFNNRYDVTYGTGIATAHASALAALISAQNDELLSPREIGMKIKNTADDIGEPGRDKQYGYGRINAHRAVTE
ncbi:MAG: S8 family serine peptidase [Reichenbachiella sp.]|uniref:S8 family serine peptidase n=3 Tax=Reichenbachiella sp. TaxID=2184521 RepID=UPI003267892C